MQVDFYIFQTSIASDSQHNFSEIEIFEIQALTVVIPTIARILIIVQLHNSEYGMQLMITANYLVPSRISLELEIFKIQALAVVIPTVARILIMVQLHNSKHGIQLIINA